jgi:hypothetical protein
VGGIKYTEGARNNTNRALSPVLAHVIEATAAMGGCWYVIRCEGCSFTDIWLSETRGGRIVFCRSTRSGEQMCCARLEMRGSE